MTASYFLLEEGKVQGEREHMFCLTWEKRCKASWKTPVQSHNMLSCHLCNQFSGGKVAAAQPTSNLPESTSQRQGGSSGGGGSSGSGLKGSVYIIVYIPPLPGFRVRSFLQSAADQSLQSRANQ